MDSSSHSRDRFRVKRRSTLRRRLLLEHLTSRRVLAAITGMVFEDVNGSLRQEANEQSLAQRLVYIDANRNAKLDTGESYAIGDDAGAFSFEGVPDGDYDLRLYDGSTTQSQTFPVDAVPSGSVVSASGLVSAHAVNQSLYGATANTVVIGDLTEATSDSLSLNAPLTDIQSLPNGSLLAVGGAGDGDAAWLIDPATRTTSTLDLSASTSATAWSDLGIDETGRGLVIENASGGDAIVVAIDASGSSVIATDVGVTVPSGAEVITTGNRSLLGWQGPLGMQLALWSNATGTWITYVPTDVTGTTDLLAFDDASGLVVLRTTDGGVSVHDANADFASLLVVPDVTGPVALDGSRDLLGTATDTSLQLFSVRDGKKIADFDIDNSAVGTVQALDWESGSDTMLVVGTSGATQVMLTAPAAHHVTIENGADPEPVSFGVTLNGENSPPFYSVSPRFETYEDEALITSAMTGVLDLEADEVVMLGGGVTPNGTALITVDGQLAYNGQQDFNGVDVVTVVLHDGRSATGAALQVDVYAVEDPPELILQLNPIPEDAPAGVILGTIHIIDPDVGDEHVVEVLDDRFEAQGDQIVFIGDIGDLDHETEPFIDLSVAVTDASGLTDEVTATLTIVDTNDPITGIEPDVASVRENDHGAVIATLIVQDQDTAQQHTLSVDDERFVVVDDLLMLAPETALDFEAGETVTVNVTATEDGANGNSFTQPIVITVLDEAEQAAEIGLSNSSVIELAPGETVGQVIVDGNPLASSYTASVDDGRFEIVGSTLKLIDRTWVERSTQEEIELVITVQDASGQFGAVTQSFVISVEENPTPYHNDQLPFDVDGSGAITPLDAIIIINYIGDFGFGPIVDGSSPIFDIDVNGDGLITALDPVLIINYFSDQSQTGGGTVSGEGEGIEEKPVVGPIQEPLPSNQDSVAEGESVEPIQGPAQKATFGPAQRVQLSVTRDASNIPAQDEVNEVVTRHAKLLGLNGEAIADGKVADEHMRLYYRVVKAIEDFAPTAHLLAEGVDASLESFLDDMNPNA